MFYKKVTERMGKLKKINLFRKLVRRSGKIGLYRYTFGSLTANFNSQLNKKFNQEREKSYLASSMQ